ncbi:hypothetical protein PQQ51_01910 [Paraburkholderia xenovorans]|uniref:hypothetical protein n=1 Tax=Paraburkholderia xenovorans TaxID=36873 RepID=UPI0038BBD138
MLAVVNEKIHPVRDVAKTSTFGQEAFRSPFGQLDYVLEGSARFYRSVARSHTVSSQWNIDDIDVLSEVGIIYSHGGTDSKTVDCMLDSGVRSIVYAATGHGNMAHSVTESPVAARARDIHVVRASRTGSGIVIRNAAQPDGP